MSNTSVGTAGVETRQSMLRVWMALSAVWVGFWLLIAAIVLATVGTRYPLPEELAPFSVIVFTPPLSLLGLGITIRWVFEALTRRRRDTDHEGRAVGGEGIALRR